MFVGKYNKSVVLTYIGVACALTGMALAINKMMDESMICLIVAGICDLFDGVVARRCKRDAEEKEFGVQIDSLADVVSFLAFPTVIGCVLMPAYLWPVLVVYVLCGIIRLAWFNMLATREAAGGYYEGLPVTYAALILPIFYLLAGLLPAAWIGAVTAVVYALVAFFFILRVKIKKPGGVWYGIFGALAVIVSVLLILK